MQSFSLWMALLLAWGHYDYFFSADGRLLSFQPDSGVNRYYLIRNGVPYDSLYTSEERSGQQRTPGAAVLAMPAGVYAGVIGRAVSGSLSAGFIDSFFVSIPPPGVFARMRATIKDDGLGGAALADRVEYVGYYHHRTDVIHPGRPQRPQSPCVAGRIEAVDTDAAFSFHSHPSGTDSCADGLVHAFISAPSQVDQVAARRYTNYIFGMRRKIIYVCTYEGVVAEVDFRYMSSAGSLPRPIDAFWIAPLRFSWRIARGQ